MNEENKDPIKSMKWHNLKNRLLFTLKNSILKLKLALYGSIIKIKDDVFRRVLVLGRNEKDTYSLGTIPHSPRKNKETRGKPKPECPPPGFKFACQPTVIKYLK